MTNGLAGRLLVATPELGDPNFSRTVVFIVEHDAEEGVLGLVLNRPSETAVGEHLPDWATFAAAPGVVFVGGPVTPEVAIGVVERPGVPPAEWSPALGEVGLVDLATSPDDMSGVQRCRVFAGYSGWVPGQLEMEIGLGSWFVLEAQPGDVFSDEPDGLWREVLRRQDTTLAWFANYPLDPSLN